MLMPHQTVNIWAFPIVLLGLYDTGLLSSSLSNETQGNPSHSGQCGAKSLSVRLELGEGVVVGIRVVVASDTLACTRLVSIVGSTDGMALLEVAWGTA